VQIALGDTVVSPGRAFEISMRFVAKELGFDWTPADHEGHRAGR
jgi:hypothetical protein